VREGLKSINLFLIKVSSLCAFWLLADKILIYKSPLFYKVWIYFYYILIRALHFTSTTLLKALGYDIVGNYDLIAIVGHYGVKLGNNCAAFGLTFCFSALIISYPGPWKKKLWFIPLGALIILIINTIRIVNLVILDTKVVVDSVFIEQHDIFNNVVYVVILLLWLVWINYLVPPKTKHIDIEN
jgi:exosortase/archaeosortase family protein